VRCTTAQRERVSDNFFRSRSWHEKAAPLRTNTKLGQRFVHVERFLRLIDEVNVVGLTTERRFRRV
jgi:hypothetical protein